MAPTCVAGHHLVSSIERQLACLAIHLLTLVAPFLTSQVRPNQIGNKVGFFLTLVPSYY